MRNAVRSRAKIAVDGGVREPNRIDPQKVLEARLRILEYALGHSVVEIMQRVLDEAELLTGSCIGFFHFIEPDQTSLRLQAWSTRTKNEFCHAEGEGNHYPIDSAGVWVDCLRQKQALIYNDYEGLAHKKGLPNGHAVVRRFIQVPILRGDLAVAIIGVGNKETDYDADDVEIVSQLADLTWDITSRRAAEEMTRKSQAYNAAILDSMRSKMAVLDKDGNILGVNRAWRDFALENGGCHTQCSGNYLEACDRAEIGSGNSSKRVKQGIIDVLEGKALTFEIEYPCVFSGKEMWFRMVVYPLDHEDGGAVVSHEDITDRHEANAKLSIALRRYRSLFELFPVAITISDKQGKIVESNAIACEMLGLTPDDISQRSIDGREWKIIRPDGTPMPAEEFASVRASNEQCVVSDVEMGIVRPDGQTRWLNVTAAPFPVEDCGVAIIYSDITDKKRSESELIASINRFSAIFHMSPVSIILTRVKDRVVIDANEAWCKLMGYERSEVVGRSSEDLKIWVNAKKRSLLVHRVKQNGSVENFEIKARRKDGSTVDIALFTDIIDVNGEQCLLFIGLDISERKRAEILVEQSQSVLEQKVEERTAELEAAYREQEAFNYTVSHDLRGPLRSLDGFSRILKADYSQALDQDGIDYLDRICSAAERMGLLVDDLLQLSRINRADMKIQEVDLGRLFCESMKRMMEMEPDRRILLEIQDDMVVHGDAVLLGAMMENLASNAWRYTSRREVASVRFNSMMLGITPVYSVADNGAGFDMKYADKLFQPFQRLHRDSEFPGVGVGLATVQRIIKRHGGSIWAHSEPGKGATFSFTFGVKRSR